MTGQVQTLRLMSDASGVAEAARLLTSGEIVAFPTETVYGLGADATNDSAVAKVFEAKDRPAFNPLIVHVSSLEDAERIAVFDEVARELAVAFWPGALTLVLPLKPASGLSRLVTAGGDLVALRVPDHALSRDLLRAVGRPIAAPSANPSGRISPTSADHVLSGLDGRIAAVLDGGPTQVGLESTILAVDPPRLLRAGGIPVEAIEAALGHAIAQSVEGAKPSAPGQLASHYAPEAQVRLNVEKAAPGEFHIGFGEIAGTRTLSQIGDLREAAARLFEVLHEADASGRPIAVAPIPDTGLGRAINDRLTRAAAPRG